MFEYSNGYGTTNSETETGSVSHSGMFSNGVGSLAGGTIYIQALDVTKKDDERNVAAVNDINDRFKSLNINVKAQLEYSDKVMSKADFYNPDCRPGANANDSYILLGTSEELLAADKQAVDGGWRTFQDKTYSAPGTSFGADQISFVNSDRMNSKIQQTGTIVNPVFTDNYKNPAESLAITAMHEAGHPIFRNHPNADRRGHVRGTIMDALPDRNSTYDHEMMQILQRLYGCQ